MNTINNKVAVITEYTEEEYDNSIKISSPSGFGVVGHLDKLPEIKKLFDEMNKCDDGLLIAFIDNDNINKPVVIVQSNKSTFYEKIHGPQEMISKVWRDYYYSAAFTYFKYIHEHWPGNTIWLDHLIHYCDWPFGMLECNIEALYNLSSMYDLSFEKVLLGCRSGGVDNDKVTEAVILIIKQKPDHHEIKSEEIQIKRFHKKIDGLTIIKVNVPYKKEFKDRL